MAQEKVDKPTTYGEIFNLSGQIGNEPITPEDVAFMRSAEDSTFGEVPKDGPASIMQRAAEKNTAEGAIGTDTHSSLPDKGVCVIETRIPGKKIDMEFIGDDLVSSKIQPTFPQQSGVSVGEAITIGEALESAALELADKPVEQSDANAIQSAEVRAAGGPAATSGVAAMAQSAAELNPRLEAKITVGEVLSDARLQMVADKIVTREDAARVLDAEMRSSPHGVPQAGGIGAALQTAADLNEQAGLVAPTIG